MVHQSHDNLKDFSRITVLVLQLASAFTEPEKKNFEKNCTLDLEIQKLRVVS